MMLHWACGAAVAKSADSFGLGFKVWAAVENTAKKNKCELLQKMITPSSVEADWEVRCPPNTLYALIGAAASPVTSLKFGKY